MGGVVGAVAFAKAEEEIAKKGMPQATTDAAQATLRIGGIAGNALADQMQEQINEQGVNPVFKGLATATGGLAGHQYANNIIATDSNSWVQKVAEERKAETAYSDLPSH